MMKEFKNESKLDFVDISTEAKRIYRFPGNELVTIENPLKIHVSKNGHRIFDEAGNSHYVPKGWIHLIWTVKKDKPNFVL